MANDYGMGFDEMLGEDPEVLRQRFAEEQVQRQVAVTPQTGGVQSLPDVGNPPKTVEELVQRQTGWGGFLEKLGTDGVWQRALLAGLQGAMAPTNPRASSSRQLFHRAATGMTKYIGLDMQAQKDAQVAQRQAEQDAQAKKAADQQIAASQQSVSASQAGEVRGTAEEARRVEKAAREAELAPLAQRQQQAQTTVAEANASPEKLALDVQEAKARLAYTQTLQAKAGKEPVKPVNEKLDMLRNSTMGQMRPGETEQTRDIRLYDYLLSMEKDANLGSMSNLATNAVRMAADPLNRDNPDIQAKGRVAQQWIDEQFPEQAPAAGGGQAPPPVVTTQAEVAKLAPGTQYIYKGKLYTRGGK